MRISIVSEYIDPGRDVPFSRRTWAIIRFLEVHGWRIQVIAPSSPDPTIANRLAHLVTYVGGYTYWRVVFGSPLAILSIPKGILNLVQTIRRSGSEVVLVAGIGPMILIEALVAARICGLPVVFDVRDSWLLMEAFHPGRIRNRIRQMLEGAALRKGDYCVAVTDRQLRLIADGYRLDRHRTLLVPNGSDFVQPNVLSSGFRFDLVHAGPPRDYHDTVSLLDSLALLRQKLSSLRVCFIGVTEDLKSKWGNQITSRGLASCVEMLPPVPPQHVLEFLRQCRAGLVSVTSEPHYRVGISTKTYDYLSAGLPILFLGPLDSEQASLVERLGIGIVAESPPDFADQAYRLLGDETKLREMKRNADSAAAEFDWNNLLAVLERKLVEVAKRTNIGGG